MNRDELQERLLIEQGWLAAAAVAAARQRVHRALEHDLCELLAREGLISPEQGDAIRLQANGILRRCYDAGLGAALSNIAERPRAGPPKRLETLVTIAISSSEQELPQEGFESESAGFEPRLLQRRNADVSAQRFRGYRLERELSRGGMGVVYAALRDKDGARVAIKFLLKEQPTDRSRVRFRREVDALKRLDHPRIVKVFEAGYESGHLFYVMEYVEGPDLKRYVLDALERGAPLPWPTVVNLMRQVAEALGHCHEAGIIHRDIKPHNIIVDPRGPRAVLIDFGLIKKDRERYGDDPDSLAQSLTREGDRVGTPAYMSPEQFYPGRDFGSVGPATDSWGFGATLFFALTGVSPFSRPTLVAIFRSMVRGPRPKITEHREDVPDWLRRICALCLEQDAAKRPTMEQLFHHLEPGRHRHLRGSRALSFLAGAVALVLLAWLAWSPGAPPLELLELTSPLAPTQASEMRISGRVNRPSALLLLSGRRTRADSEGRFDFRLELSEGVNNLQLSILTSGEQRRLLKALSVIRDTRPPRLEVRGRGALGQVSLGSEGLVLVEVQDASAVTLEADGVILEAIAPRRYVLRRPLGERPERVRFTARDAAANTTSLECELLSPAAQREAERQRALLDRLSDWRGASEGDQDGAIREVARRLGQGYIWRDTRLYGNAARPNRLARFTHRASRLDLMLIPGGALDTIGAPSDEGGAEIEKIEAKLAEAQSYLTTLEFEKRRLQRLRLDLEDIVKAGRLKPSRPELLESLAQLEHDAAGQASLRRRLRLTSPLSTAELEARADADPVFATRLAYALVLPDILRSLEDIVSDAPTLVAPFAQRLGLAKPAGFAELAAALEKAPERLAKLETLSVTLAKGMLDSPLPLADPNQHDTGIERWGRVVLGLEQRLEAAALLDTIAPRSGAVLVAVRELTRGEHAVISQTSIDGDPNLPKTGLSWLACRAWLASAGAGLRFPLEREWVYVARLNARPERFVWHLETSDGRAHASALERRTAEPLGLLDMEGNVSEWCQDPWRRDPLAAPATATRLRVLRGGDFSSSRLACQARRRSEAHEGDLATEHGLRPFMTVP